MKLKLNRLLKASLLIPVSLTLLPASFLDSRFANASPPRSAYIELCGATELAPSDRPLVEAIQELSRTTDCVESDQWLSRQTGVDLSNRALESLRGLSGLPNLRDLWLQGNRIRDLEPIATLPSLRKLSLENNLIKTTQTLHQMSGLRVVWLERNRLSFPEISRLETALPRTSVIVGDQQRLSEFCLDSRNSESEKIWCELLKRTFGVETAEELENKTQIEKISIDLVFFSFWKFKDRPFRLRIGDFHYFPRLRELQIYGRPSQDRPIRERIEVTTDGLNDLAGLNRLNFKSILPHAASGPTASPQKPISLRLADIPESDILSFLSVPAFSEKINHLTVSWTRISGLDFLRSIPSLESIFLMALENPDLEFPTGLPNLTSIDLQTRVRSLEFLREYPSLKHLHLVLRESDPIPEMIQDLHHLEDLLLEGRFSQIPPLSPKVSLRSLRLMTDRPLSLEPVKRHMDLEELNLGRTFSLREADWNWISSLPRLKTLILPIEFQSHPAINQLKTRGVSII